MGDSLVECFSAFCGVCCIAISSTITQWSSTSRLGAQGTCCCCSRNAGCCGLCCDKSFNEDRFEDEVQKDMAKTRNSNVPAEQPKASPDMTVPAPDRKERVQTPAEAQESSAGSPKEDVKPPPS